MILQLPFLFKRLFAQAADDGIPPEVKVLLLLFIVLFHGCPFEIRFTLLHYSIISRDHGVHVLWISPAIKALVHKTSVFNFICPLFGASYRVHVHLVQNLYYFNECNLWHLKLRAYHQRKNTYNILTLKKKFKYKVQNKTISSIIFFLHVQVYLQHRSGQHHFALRTSA